MDIYSETDDESYESWYNSYDDHDESESDDLSYGPEEQSSTKYNIVLCELYNNQRHGISSDEINYHYLTHLRLKMLDTDFIKNFLFLNILNLNKILKINYKIFNNL